MCMYCERRTNIKFGLVQPELPWHDNTEIKDGEVRECQEIEEQKVVCVPNFGTEGRNV